MKLVPILLATMLATSAHADFQSGNDILNNINSDKTLNAEIKFQPLGYPDFVVVNITVEVP